MPRLLAVFLAMFLCYQSAEGVGMHWLHEPAWQAALMTATIPVGLLLAAWAWHAPLRSFAMQPRRGALSWLLVCVGGAVVLKVVAVFSGGAMGVYTIAWHAGTGVAPVALAAMLGLALVSTFVPSLAEDMLTRGLLAARFRWRTPTRFVVVSTLVYVFNHVWRLSNGPTEWLLLSAFGAAYAVALVCSGTLWAAVGLHWGWNLANAVLPLAADVQVRSPASAVGISVAAHMVMLLACLSWRRRSATSSSGPGGNGHVVGQPSDPGRGAFLDERRTGASSGRR